MRTKHLVRHFLRCRNGNFGILTAGGFVCLAATAGVAVDLNRMIDLKSQLQAAADAGALAGVSAMAQKGAGASTAEKVASDFTSEQIKKLGVTSEVTVAAPKVVADAVTTPLAGGQLQYEVTVSASKAFEVSGLTRLLGVGARHVSVIASAVNDGSGTEAFSLLMVLDVSGSMRHPKSVHLQQAANGLLDVLRDGDISQSSFRTGGISFAGQITDAQQMTFDLSSSYTFIRQLKFGGDTDSSTAMEEALRRLTLPKEDEAHRVTNGSLNPNKYILFMTDGDNDDAKADTETIKWCNRAKAKGIIIYAIGFGMTADDPGGILQTCASTGLFWRAANASQLLTQFKRIGQTAIEPTTAKGSRLKS